eukprot:GHVU01211809.1.p2 GENE.GHVU01211809.1~~GHVU01211809.1.p2  ORF type:complete len:124 (+),score=16.72 GHVU01211809.1:383-754(+)
MISIRVAAAPAAGPPPQLTGGGARELRGTASGSVAETAETEADVVQPLTAGQAEGVLRCVFSASLVGRLLEALGRRQHEERAEEHHRVPTTPAQPRSARPADRGMAEAQSHPSPPGSSGSGHP